MPSSSTSTTTSQTTITLNQEQNDENVSLPSSLSTLIPITKTYNTQTHDDHSTTLSPASIPVVNIKSRSKVESIYAIEDMQGVQAKEQSLHGTYLPKNENQKLNNSRIYKLKMHRSQRSRTPQHKRYHSYQYKKSKANCHEKRSASGSIL